MFISFDCARNKKPGAKAGTKKIKKNVQLSPWNQVGPMPAVACCCVVCHVSAALVRPRAAAAGGDWRGADVGTVTCGF